MGWKIKIGEGLAEFVFDEDAKFNYSWSKNVNPEGKVESVDNFLTVEGSIINTTPDTVADDFVLASQEVTLKLGEVRIQSELDGVNKFDWKPEEGFFGPHVTSFDSIADDGNADSHWRFRMVVHFRSKGTSQGAEQVSNFSSSLEVTKFFDRVIRKVWTIVASATSAAAAEAFVKTFKPSGKDIEERVKPSFQDLSATAVFTWTAVQEIQETVVTIGGREDYFGDRQAGTLGGGRVPKDAILHLMQRDPLTITITGQIVSYTPLKPSDVPPPHFSNSATIRRATALEQDTEVEVVDGPRSIHVLRYQEVWKSVGPTPAPKHSGAHQRVKFIKRPPPDGKVRI